MRNIDLWRPTKFVMIEGQLRADRTGVHVAVSSQIMADLLARDYSSLLKIVAKGRLLDLGCGNVPLYETYRERVDETVCLDWPNSMHDQKHIDVFADLTRALPLQNATFDTVLLSDVLEHIPNAEGLVGEVARVLRPGGHAVIGVPFMYWLHEIPHDYNRYTRYQLSRLIENTGLDVVHLTELAGAPEVIADIIGKTLALASRPRVTAAFVKLARWMLDRTSIGNLSTQTRPLFPIGYVVIGQKGET